MSYRYSDLITITEDKWGEGAVVEETSVDGIYNTYTERHGGYLVDVVKHPELSKYGDKTDNSDIRAFEEDYEALKVLWLFPQLIENQSAVDEWLNEDTVIKYDDNKKFIEEFPKRKTISESGREDSTFENEENTTILDLLQERIGQRISIGELNIVLQSIFAEYDKIYLMANELYNMDIDEVQELSILEDGDFYIISYKIMDLNNGIVQITDVNVE